MAELKIKDQVVIRESILKRGAATNRVEVGTILAFKDAQTAVVSVQKPGGVTNRKEIPLAKLQPVSEQFKRASVQANPVHRQIGLRSM